MQINKFQSWLLLILLSLIWGSSYMLMKVGLHSFSPIQVAVLRIGLSGLALLPFFYVHMTQTTIVTWLWCMVVGIIGNFIPFICFAFAQSVISSSMAGMLNTLQPLFTLLVGLFIFQHQVPRIQMTGVLIGFAGAAILLGINPVAMDYSENFMYSLLVVLATFCYGISANIIRAKLSALKPIKITSLSLGLLIVPCFILLLLTDIEAPFSDMEQFYISSAAILFLGFVGTAFAILLFNKILKDAGMMMATSVAYLIPIVAIFWGIIYGEEITSNHLIGTAIIFIGLSLVNRGTIKPSSTPIEAST